MKYLVFAAIALFACVAARPDDKYTTKYDGVNVEEILKSDRLFNNYFKCLMDKGKCTPDGSELKRVLPDALQSGCTKCSEKQRDGTERVIRFLTEKKPQQWEQLQDKYDPEHKYVQKFKSEAANIGINV